MGEIVHDLRSALDHVAWELVLDNHRTPDRATSFPICKNPPSSGFADWAQRPAKGRKPHGPLFGLTNDAVGRIEACQPFQGGDNKLLLVLHDLWNRDKHRQLLPTWVMTELPTVEVSGGSLVSMQPERGRYGAPFIGVRVDATDGSRPQVKIVEPVPVFLAFHNGLPVIDTLTLIADHVQTSVWERLHGIPIRDNAHLKQLIAEARQRVSDDALSEYSERSGPQDI